MSETERIREAEYFYAQMAATREIRDHFTFNLSAFLSAAHSALQIARKHAESRLGGYAWYELSMGKSPVLGFFKDKRTANVHAQPVAVFADREAHAREENLMTYRFDDWSGVEDVFQLCAGYLSELRTAVADGRSKGFLG